MKIKIFLSHQRDWQNFEQDNKSIAPNTLFSSQNIEEITLVYKSEHNFKQENKLLLLMINYDEKYYYFAVKIKLELYSSEQSGSKNKSITNGDNCFQNALDDALDYQRIKKDPHKISKLKPYINKYNWKDIKFPSDKEDWEKFEQHNKETTLNILFVPHIKEEIRQACIYQNITASVKNQVILLMITADGKRWHYLVVRSLSAFLRAISSINNGEFYCLKFFHSYRTLNKFKNMKEYVITMIIVAQTCRKKVKIY